MRDVPLPDEDVQHAIHFAIEVNAPHYADTGDETTYEVLQNAQQTLLNEGYLPGDAVPSVWDILMEYNHFKIASAPDYNNGTDRKPLINAVHMFIVFNGDHLFDSYADYRKQAWDQLTASPNEEENTDE